MVSFTADPERRWYIIQTYSGYENRVKANIEQRIANMGLEDRIFRVVVPIEERAVNRDGKIRRVKRKVFPTYVLAEMILDDQSWYMVRHTPGVAGFVGYGDRPMPLSQKEVSDIMSKITSEDAKPKIEIPFKPGDIIKVKNGPFENQVGPVVEIDEDKGTVKFSVTVFGRETVVEAGYTDLDKL